MATPKASFDDLLKLPKMISDLQQMVEDLKEEVGRLRAAMPADLVTVPDAAKRLNITSQTVRRHLKANTLKGVRVGQRVLVDLSHLTQHVTKDEILEMAGG